MTTTTGDRRTTPREQRSQTTKQRIYDTAIDLITANGFDNVTVADICQGAGVAVGTFYHFFNSKESTLLNCLATEDHAVEALLTRLNDASPTERIRQLFCNRVRMGTVEKTVDLSIACAVAHLKNGELESYSSLREVYQALREQVVTGQAQGLFESEVDPDTFVEGLMFIAGGLIQAWQLAGGEYPVMERADEQAMAQIRAILRRPQA